VEWLRAGPQKQQDWKVRHTRSTVRTCRLNEFWRIDGKAYKDEIATDKSLSKSLAKLGKLLGTIGMRENPDSLSSAGKCSYACHLRGERDVSKSWVNTGLKKLEA
jgi:hypothetical protein